MSLDRFDRFCTIFMQVFNEFSGSKDVQPTDDDLRYFFYQVPGEPVGAAMRYLKAQVIKE